MNTLATVHQPAEDLQHLDNEFQRLKTSFSAKPYPSLAERRQLIKQLKQNVLSNEEALYQALNQDYGYRSEFDSLLADVMPSVQQLNYVYKKKSKKYNTLEPNNNYINIG